MILQNFALKRGKEITGHNLTVCKLQSWTKNRKKFGLDYDSARRYASNKPTPTRVKEELAKENCEKLSNRHGAKKKAKEIDRDFFVSVLGSSATKREARSYIQRFTPPKAAPPDPTKPAAPEQGQKENEIGSSGFSEATRALAESPKFLQQPAQLNATSAGFPIHVALVKIRAPQTLDDETLEGVGRTLSQLGQLGLSSIVVVDCDDGTESDDAKFSLEWRNMVKQQANRVVAAIDNSGKAEARLVDTIIGISEEEPHVESPSYLQGKAHVALRDFLMTPLRRGVFPVIPPIGYMDATSTAKPLKASEVVLALTRELAGLSFASSIDPSTTAPKEQLEALRSVVSLDRLIILDPLGGIPTSDWRNGYHVFLNMEQEYESAKADLLKTGGIYNVTLSPTASLSHKEQISGFGAGNPISEFAEHEFGKSEAIPDGEDTVVPKDVPCTTFHLDNLDLVRKVLSILPPSSSALLTTPDEAANSGRQPEFMAAGVGTRRQRNPLIHNLLTDKPVFSSSLPVERLGQVEVAEPVSPSRQLTPTTFAKHGMSVTTFPNPKLTPWQPPIAGTPQIKLTDPRIDLPRLVHLIEDSFNKKLDVQDYLRRVNDRIAGVIIAGEYEGGALLTWELPPGVPDDGSEESRRRMVPYLDKFAVLKRINKWYFERSRATLKLPGTNWTMFFTTPEQNMDHQTFKDYEAVCSTIEPSWADKGGVQD
ncbi:amino-acid mitochondrial protein [Rutstroemia sp. NJR-2017a WRK4]|nr:amino-acid mitochondrial protein [Rutstroemia sp. NJR-2017a WRK4]